MREDVLERRMTNVRILLRTLHDIYPGPTSLNQTPQSGSAPGRRAPCRVCNAGSRPPRKQVTSCPGCDGDGWRRRRPGEPEWDEYTSLVVATEEAPKKALPMSPARLDAELARVQHDLILREGLVDPDEQFSWERARKARDSEASYVELERVLDLMQIEQTLLRSFVTFRYFDGLVSSEGSFSVLDDIAVRWIAERMHGRIRIPRRFYEEQIAERRDRVRSLLRLGLDELTIAREVGVSRRFVRNESAGTLRVSLGTGSHDRQCVGTGTSGEAIP